MTLVAGATSGAALAYLTDGETAENTFIIGDVSIKGIRREAPDFDNSVNASLKKVQKKIPILFASMSVCIISSAQA